MSEHRFVCADCGEEKVHTDSLTTGYGINREGRKVCYSCCGKRDSAEMTATGRAVLYLTEEAGVPVVTNWPGTLRLRVTHTRKGSHNIAGSMVSIWFTDLDGREWHGRNIGDNQILRCKRLKVA